MSTDCDSVRGNVQDSDLAWGAAVIAVVGASNGDGNGARKGAEVERGVNGAVLLCGAVDNGRAMGTTPSRVGSVTVDGKTGAGTDVTGCLGNGTNGRAVEGARVDAAIGRCGGGNGYGTPGVRGKPVVAVAMGAEAAVSTTITMVRAGPARPCALRRL
jgi:hypothetical protein